MLEYQVSCYHFISYSVKLTRTFQHYGITTKNFLHDLLHEAVSSTDYNNVKFYDTDE